MQLHSTPGFLLAFFLAFFSSIASAQTKPDTQFRVGLVIPLTGPAASYGVAIKNCIEMAAKDKPELFTNIHFQYEDAAFDPKTAVSAFNKLSDIDKVDLAITWGVSFCKALSPIAEAKKMPLVGICLDPTIAAGKKYVMRFDSTTDELMQIQAKYLFDHNVKRIGLLVAEHPYLEEMTQALQRNLQKGQTLTIVEQLPNNEMDLRPHILKLQQRKSEFDSVGIFLFAGQISTFYKQANDLKFNLPTFGTDFFESLSEVQASNGTMEGLTYASIDIKEDFAKRYKALYNNESQLGFGAPAYEFAISTGELFNKNTSKVSAEEIMKRFASLGEHEGTAAGPFRFRNDPTVGQYIQFPVVMKKVVAQSFKRAE